MIVIKGWIALLSILSIFEIFEGLKFQVSAQIPIIVSDVNIPNCSESFIDTQGVERCQVCQSGFTKAYDLSACKLATVKACIWESQYGCLECECGYAVSYDLTHCVEQKIEGCLRLDSTGNGCIQPKLGYIVEYTEPSGVFTYVSIKADTGEYCGWIKSGVAGCSKCQAGFFLETGGKSCKKLPNKLQNEQFIWLNSNVMTDPTVTIQFIPGWEQWLAKTNAGAFQNPIVGCIDYDDVLNLYNNIALCRKCVKGQIPTQNQLQCVVGNIFCQYADNNIPHKCIKCINDLDYWADSVSNTCIVRNQMFDNCDIRAPDKDECQQCSKLTGYILDATKKCQYVSDCKESDGLTNCTICNEQFQLEQSPAICTKLKVNCLIQDASKQCTTCAVGYYVWQGNCYLKTPNCDVVDSSNAVQANHKCSSCLTGFHMVDFNCYKNIPFCTTYFTTGKDGCVQCQTMYTPSTDGLECLLHNLQFQKYCQLTDGKGNCLQCISLKFIPRCLDITNYNLCLVSNGKDNKCIQCLPNAILNNNICQQADTNCLRTDGSNQCKQCKMGYYIDATFNCSPISNCSVSDGVLIDCLACNDGYILNNKQCDVKSAGCSIEIFDGTTKKCIQCLTGYKLDATGKCILIASCTESNGIGTDNTCYLCNVNQQYDPTNKVCTVFNPNPIYQPPQFCNIFYLTNLPNQSYDGPTITGCSANPAVPTAAKSYTFTPSYGICLQCQTPRVLRWRLDTGDCTTAVSIIQECVELSAIGTLIDNCRIYDFITGKCRLCENNYTLKVPDGLCIPSPKPYCKYTISPLTYSDSGVCQVCIDGVYYEKVSQSCKLTVSNCSNYGTTGCTACQSKFYYKNSQLCVPYAGQSCNQWNSDFSQCTQCNTNYEYKTTSNSNICLYNPYKLNCSTITNNICNGCAAGKILVRDNINNPNCLGLSSHPDLNCIEYNSSNICARCAAGYVLQRSLNNQIYLLCVTKDADCTAIDPLTSTCQTCATKYLDKTYNSAGCVQIDKCIVPIPSLSDGTGCKQCDNTLGYYLQSDGFSCLLLDNCVQTTDGINPFCYKCQKGYYPYIGGVCALLVMPGCIDNSGIDATCKQCTDGYYLDSNFKCQFGDITSNCLKFDPINFPTNGNKCAVCNPGYKLDGTTFLCVVIPNCEISDGTSTATCTLCKIYFYMSGTNCVQPDVMIDYCSRYKPDQSCDSCEVAFYLVGGACLRRTTRYDYCKYYDYAANVCLLCQNKGIGGVIVKDEYSPKLGFCNPVQIDKCDTYLQNSPKCSLCTQDTDYAIGWLVPSQNYCKDVTKSLCLTINPQGTKCTSCQQGVNFYYKDTAICQTLCVGGYSTGNPSVCTNYTPANVANCDITDPTKDECQLCAKSYVKNATTKICEKMTVANCADNGPKRDQTCVECAQDYMLSSNACTSQPTIANCAIYVKNTGICGLCNNLYYLSNDGQQCNAITAGATCKVNSIDSDICLICLDNTYTISSDGKACFVGRATSNCLVSSSTSPTSQCQVCIAGFIPVLGSKNCIQDNFNLPGCVAVTQLSGNTYYSCAQCKVNYNLQNNICIPSQGLSTCAVPNCQVYSSYLYDSAQCKKCIIIPQTTIPYSLVNNKCVFTQSGAHLTFIIIIFIGITFSIL